MEVLVLSMGVLVLSTEVLVLSMGVLVLSMEVLVLSTEVLVQCMVLSTEDQCMVQVIVLELFLSTDLVTQARPGPITGPSRVASLLTKETSQWSPRTPGATTGPDNRTTSTMTEGQYLQNINYFIDTFPSF